MKTQPSFTEKQVLACLNAFTAHLSRFDSNDQYGPGWVRGVCREIITRGIGSAENQGGEADVLAMLRHALAFIEHDHSFADSPASECDSIKSSVEGGPVMKCDLAGIRAAIAKAEGAK